MDELWVDVVGYEGGYQVSNLGRVKSLPRAVPNGRHGTINRKGKILKGRDCGKGYLKVRLSGKQKPIHRLVAEAFIPNPENKPHVNHINLNKQDNCVENLEWCTHSENMSHARQLGVFLENQIRGEDVKVGKLNTSAVQDIRTNFNVGAGRGNVYFANKYGVSTVNIRRVRKYKIWKHVP